MLKREREQRVPQFTAVFDHIHQTGEGKQWAVVCWMFSVAHQQRPCFMFSDFTNILDFISWFFLFIICFIFGYNAAFISKKTSISFWFCLKFCSILAWRVILLVFHCCSLVTYLIWSRRVKSSLNLSFSFRPVLLSLVCQSVCPRHLSVLHLRLWSVGFSSPRHRKSCQVTQTRLGCFHTAQWLVKLTTKPLTAVSMTAPEMMLIHATVHQYH